jgi:hypothetical protein
MGDARRFEPATVAVPFPLSARAYRSAACPGASSDPEIIAAKVSRMWCFACSTTSAGRARAAAPAMYELSVIITGPGLVV